MAQNVQFIYFDLDDTLLDHRTAERNALADVHHHFDEHFVRHGIEHVRDTYNELNMALWRRYGDGEIAREELQRLRFEQLLMALEIDSLTHDTLGEYYLSAYERHWELFDGAPEAFHALADAYPVGILTNGFAELQRAKLARFPEIGDRLDALVISDEVGYPKPHPRIFAYAAEKAQTAPEDILFVGNSYHSDVCGGYDAGWQVAWFTELENAPPEMDAGSIFCFREWDHVVAHASGAYSPI